MSTFFIPIPVAHFRVRLRLPLHHAFINFLTFVRAQPAQLHPNAVRNVMAFIVLCCRHGVEFTPALLQTFFTPLQMVDNLLSLRPRRNQVALFNPLPNRVDWKNKWVTVESRVGFPFHPLVGQCSKWSALPSNALFSDLERRFLDVIAEKLGTDPLTQTQVYCMADLLNRASLAWCGIGSRLEAHRSKSIQVGASSWLHPDFKIPSSLERLPRLSEEIVAHTMPLNNIKFTNCFTASFLGLSTLRHSVNVDSYHVLKDMFAEESANRVDSLLAQVSVLFYSP